MCRALSNAWSRHTFPHTHNHPRKPFTHVPSQPAVQRGQKTSTRARLRGRSALSLGCARQPSGSVPSWSLSREAQCVISKQKESSSFPAGRKSRVWGWVGGRVGTCKGAGRVCWGNRHVNTDRAWYMQAGGSKAGWGKEPGQQCAFVCVQPSLCALGVGVCLPVSAFFPILDF